MYYTKKFTSEKDKVVPKYDARGILRVLNFFPFINLRNVKHLKEAMEDKKWISVLCDMTAAAITQFHYQQMIDLGKVWGTVGMFFHQAIQMRGFDPVPNPKSEFNQDKEGPSQIEILVAGTQSPDVYRARVEGAIRILQDTLPNKCRIVFSGANAARSMQRMGLQGGVETLNEAADMELYFRRKMESEPLPENTDLTLSRETESDTTMANIKNFFQQVKLSKMNRNHIYVVSSLFHLPRFIDLTLPRLAKLKIPVNELTFVSAEDPWKKPTDAVGTEAYLKSCMYEFFFQLYQDTPGEQIFNPVGKPV